MTPARRLGQHFLTDANILRKIVDALDPAPTDVVLEIGAGKGSLTQQLLARGLRVIAVEKDRRLAAEIRTERKLSCLRDFFPQPAKDLRLGPPEAINRLIRVADDE